MSHYPNTIDNGAGEELTFLGVRSDERGEYLEVRNAVAPGSGPPMHVHRLQEESLTVERGTMGWQHRFWNPGDDDLVCTGYVRPPDNIEYFLTQIYASTRATGGKRPRLFDAAYLSLRYRSEFAIAEIPAPVQRFVFPVVVTVGRLRGLHKRFAGAPEPVTRTPSV